jgi:PAS domain S-box-containing protein
MNNLTYDRLSPPREQEAFRAMFEQAGFGVAQVSLDGEWLAVNQVLCDILGYSRTELLAEPLHLITRHDELGAEEAECQKLLKGEIQSFSSQKRHLRRDGRVTWLKGTVTLVRNDETGAPNRFLAIIEDRTAHHKAIQLALSQSDKNFRVLTENISDLFFTLDLELKCSFWNRAAESLTGILASAVLGRKINEAFSAVENTAELENAFREVLATRHARSFTFACRIADRDFLFEVTAYPSLDGISVVARDIGSRKRTEQALRTSEEKFAKAFQASPAMITIVRISDGHYIEVNRAFEKLTGFLHSEVIGNPISQVRGPADLQSLHQAFDNAVYFGSVRNMEAPINRTGSDPLIVLLSADIVEFDGEPCVLTVAEDITERKQAEVARIDLSRRLMTAQEAERRRIARELHDGIGQSLALLSVQLQRAERPPSEGKKQPSIQELCAKVKDIGIQVSRLSHQLHSSELEFLGLAVAVKGLCREFGEQYHIPVDCTCSDIPPQMDSDAALSILRVVQEALHNIAKHSHATSATVELRRLRNNLQITISDNGSGFDANKARSARGLGLVSMRERIHLMGGHFEIFSNAGDGTKIQARVPVERASR